MEITLYNFKTGRKEIVIAGSANIEWSDYVPVGAASNLYQLLIIQDGFTPINAALYVLKKYADKGK